MPSSPPHLLSSSRLESTHGFETGIGNKQPGYNSTSVSNQGRRSVNPPNSTISIPLYDYNNLRHKSNVRNSVDIPAARQSYRKLPGTHFG